MAEHYVYMSTVLLLLLPLLPGVVFGSHHHTFRRWLYLWLKQLAAHATGPLAGMRVGLQGTLENTASVLVTDCARNQQTQHDQVTCVAAQS